MKETAEFVMLRERKRLETMLRVQDVALGLFEERGYDPVSIEEIARQSAVGVATVYRHFGTKERIVLWDEYDAEIFSSLDQVVRKMRTLQAMCTVLGVGLSKVCENDRRRVLRRGRLVLKVPALQAAQHTDTLKMGETLSEILVNNRVFKSRLQCDVAGSFIASSLAIAATHWIRSSGRKDLNSLLTEAFATAERL
jgi:AcrR family transcriptional regulator